MHVSQSYIIEERQFDDKTIICHIKIAPRFVEYYHGQPKHQTHRWMFPEYWAKFDAKLEKLLKNGDLTKTSNEKIFNLNELVSVKAKNSKISVDQVKPFMQNANMWNATLVLEFVIEFKHEKGKKGKYISSASDEINDYNHEYEPAFVSKSSETLSVPYTPSVKSTISTKNHIFGSSSDTHCNELLHEEPYSPKPLSEDSPDKSSETPCIPTYKPMQMNRCEPANKEKDKVSKIESNDCNQRKVKFKSKSVENIIRFTEQNNDIENEKHKIRQKDKIKKDNKEKCVPDSSPNEVGVSTEKSDGLPNNEGLISTEKSEKRKRNLTDSSEMPPQTRLRSSSRDPVELTHCLETGSSDGTAISQKKNLATKHKSANTMNLFGSDDDDYQNEDFDENSNAKKIHSKVKSLQLISPRAISAEVVKKKKKPESSLDHKKEETAMDNWLEKKSTAKLEEKKPTPTIADALRIKKRSSPITYLNKEEIVEKMVIEKEQIKKNRRLKRALEKVAGPPPAKVKTLSIQDLSENEVLDSFESYKTKLDKLFQSNSKNWHTVKGHDGINHVFVITLVDEKIQLKMLNKLYSEYEPGGEGISAHLSLYANALLPEWILRIFMDRYKLTRDEAIAHIKAQEAYKIHKEAKMELES